MCIFLKIQRQVPLLYIEWAPCVFVWTALPTWSSRRKPLPTRCLRRPRERKCRGAPSSWTTQETRARRGEADLRVNLLHHSFEIPSFIRFSKHLLTPVDFRKGCVLTPHWVILVTQVRVVEASKGLGTEIESGPLGRTRNDANTLLPEPL